MGPAAKWTLGLLIISAFFTGIAGFIGQIESNYELDLGPGWSNVSETFLNVNNNSNLRDIDETYASAEGNWSDGSDTSAGLTGWALSWPGHIIKTFTGVFRTILGLGSVTEEMISTTANEMNLDATDEGTQLVTLLISIAAFALIFIGLRAYMGREV